MKCKKILLLNYLATKLNHYLANILTGINQSIELLQTDNKLIRDQSFHLLRNTTNRMTNTLKIFNHMYSDCNNDFEYYLKDIYDLLADFLGFNEIEIEFSDNNKKVVSGNLGKLIICLVYMLSSMLIKKSKIVCELNASDNIIILSNTKSGFNKNYYENIIQIFSTDAEIELNYYNVHAYYTKYLAHLLKSKIFVNLQYDNLKIITTKYD